jgi:hypothetical protein
MANVVHAGWATKQGAQRKNWKRRYFVLFRDMSLAYFEDVVSTNKSPKVRFEWTLFPLALPS